MCGKKYSLLPVMLNVTLIFGTNFQSSCNIISIKLRNTYLLQSLGWMSANTQNTTRTFLKLCIIEPVQYCLRGVEQWTVVPKWFPDYTVTKSMRDKVGQFTVQKRSKNTKSAF